MSDNQHNPDIAVRINHLSRTYRDGDAVHPVLRDIKLEIGHGECVALLGRSGSGKSTLLNLIAGIDRPDGGCIDVGNTTITALGEPDLTRFRRRHVGFVYQFFNLIPTLTAAENIALPLELIGTPATDVDGRVTDMLARIGLQERGLAFPDQLSGGEQQRVAVARALIHRPSLLLADEPTGNLDQQSAAQVLQLMLVLAKHQRAAVLLVTHSRAVAERADRLVTLVDGQLVASGMETAW